MAKCTMSGGWSSGAFLHVKYGRTWRHAHMHTHTHTQEPLARCHTLSTAPLQMGILRPSENPPHTLRLNRARAPLPDVLGLGSPWMSCHRVCTGAEQLQRPWPRVGQTPQLREKAGATQGHTASPGAWQWVIHPLSPLPRTPLPTHGLKGANLGRRTGPGVEMPQDKVGEGGKDQGLQNSWLFYFCLISEPRGSLPFVASWL